MPTSRGALIDVVADSSDYGEVVFRDLVAPGNSLLVVAEGNTVRVYSLASDDAAIADLTKTLVSEKAF
jgi:hypothetical protein